MKESKPPAGPGFFSRRTPGCTYSWRNCLSRSLRVAFPCQCAPARQEQNRLSNLEEYSFAGYPPCGSCQNCTVFSWSYLEATAWLAGHVIGVGSFYYCCLIPYFEENKKYVRGLKLVVPGSPDDKLTAQLAQCLFEILLPFRLCLRLVYSFCLLPFELLYRLTSVRLFLYTPSSIQSADFSQTGAFPNSKEDPYLIDDDAQFSTFRNAIPLILLAMAIHGLFSFLLRKYVFRFFLTVYSDDPCAFVSAIRFWRRKQAGARRGSFASRTLYSKVRGTAAACLPEEEEESLFPSGAGEYAGSFSRTRSSSSSPAKRAWIATQRVHIGFELVVGLGFGLYLHSAHLLVLLLYSLVNYAITLLLPPPPSTSCPPSLCACGASCSVRDRGRENYRPKSSLSSSPSTTADQAAVCSEAHPDSDQGQDRARTLDVKSTLWKAEDRLRCAMVIILTFALHFALLLYHGSTVHFSLAFIHPFFRPLEILFFSVLSPIYSLHDCVRLVALKMLSFNLDKVWTLRLRHKAAQGQSAPSALASLCRNATPRAAASPSARVFERKNSENDTGGGTSQSSPLRPLSSCDVESKVEESSPSLFEKRSCFFSCQESPNPFDDERFFPSDSINIPYCTYTSITRYMAYVFYAPTYLAGPTVTYNSWNRQSAFPWWVILAHNSFVRRRELTEAAARVTDPAEGKTLSRNAERSASSGTESLSTCAPVHPGSTKEAKKKNTAKCTQKDREAAGGVHAAAVRRSPFDLMISPNLLDLPFSMYGKVFLKKVIPYFLRWLLAMLFLEIHMRYLPVNALVTKVENFPLWTQMQLRELLIMSVTVLCFMWLKFFCLWRLCRLWSILAGVVPPENMVRFLYNNYSTEKFWRGWHRSFNLYLIRYVYIPLNRLFSSLTSYPSSPAASSSVSSLSPSGRLAESSETKSEVSKEDRHGDHREECLALHQRRNRGGGGGGLVGRCVSSCLVFLYVAFWHEINLKVFLWGLACAACYVPEAILRHWAFPSPSAAKHCRDRGDGARERGRKENSSRETQEGGDFRAWSEGQDRRHFQVPKNSEHPSPLGWDVVTAETKRRAQKEKLPNEDDHQLKEHEVSPRTPCAKSRVIHRVVSLFPTDIRQKKVFKYICVLAGAANIFLLCFCNLVGYSYGAEGMQLIADRIVREEGILSALRAASEVLLIFFLATGGMLVIRALEGGRKNY